MSVVVETTLGDLTIDLFTQDRPQACINFLKLCKIKYYNFNLFHTVQYNFLAQTGDPTGSRAGGSSIWSVLNGPTRRYFAAANQPKMKHDAIGTVSFVNAGNDMYGSQFYITLGDELGSLDGKHLIFGQVVEGVETLRKINAAICDEDDRPYQDIRITHTVILDDPFPNPERLTIPSRSPSPSDERLQNGRIAADEAMDEATGKSAEALAEMVAQREAKARAIVLEMIGDIPDADMAPPENVLFVCKLNPVTTDDDLEIIFSRFGTVVSAEVIRDKKSGDSLQYAFVEFDNKKSCEDAYFKMDNVLIDDRRIHVDFSQSVSKMRWLGKGRGVQHLDNGAKQPNKPKRDDENRNDQPKRPRSSSRTRRNNRNRSRDLSSHNRRQSPDRKRADTRTYSRDYSRNERRRSRSRDTRRYHQDRNHRSSSRDRTSRRKSYRRDDKSRERQVSNRASSRHRDRSLRKKSPRKSPRKDAKTQVCEVSSSKRRRSSSSSSSESSSSTSSSSSSDEKTRRKKDKKKKTRNGKERAKRGEKRAKRSEKKAVKNRKKRRQSTSSSASSTSS